MKLLPLIQEAFNKKKSSKFVGSPNDFRVVKKQEIIQSPQKIKVTKKSTGDTYWITKKWYESHKEEYQIPKQSKPNKMVGGAEQVKVKKQIQPKNIKEFTKMYFNDKYTKGPKSKDIQYNDQLANNDLGIRMVVHAYTHHLYQDINEALRNGSKLTAPKKEAVDDISQFLSKAKKYDGVVKRIVAFNDEGGFSRQAYDNFTTKGNILQHLSFCSTTHNVGDSPSKLTSSVGVFNKYSKDYNLMLIIKSKSGVPIQSISEYRNQMQILFDKGVKFKIIDHVHNAMSGFTQVYMIEV